MSDSVRANLEQDILRAIGTGRCVLVTGAGFSAGALDATGQSLPLGAKMAQEIWPIAFGDEAFDPSSRLAEIFGLAMKSSPSRLREYMEYAFTIDRESLPRRYVDWLDLPWHRAYTLNVDDLPVAVAEQVPPPHLEWQILSALTSRPGDVIGGKRAFVELHGSTRDFPNVTFSPQAFAQRTATPDPWYEQFVADITDRPSIFVGTKLDEQALWHYLEQRGHTRGVELRPRSYLVTPSLPRARASLLDDLNIELVQATEEEFFDAVLQGKGQELREEAAIREPVRDGITSIVRLEDVLDSAERGSPDFLVLGTEPTWADVTAGFAVQRDFDSEFVAELSQLSEAAVVLHGTAGAGVSTCLRTAAVALHASGRKVIWIDRETTEAVREIRDRVDAHAADIVFIDGLDRFGNLAASLLLGISQSGSGRVAVGGLRSPRIRLTQRPNIVLRPIGDLTHADSVKLAEGLDRAGRLGDLRSVPPTERPDRIMQEWNGQLLVTMIQVTSGEKFHEKIWNELEQLDDADKAPYAMLALASYLDEQLSVDDVIIGAQNDAGLVFSAVQSLIASKLVRRYGDMLSVRHRVVGESLVASMRKMGELKDVIRAVLRLASVKYSPSDVYRTRHGRMMVRLLNHDHLYSLLGDAELTRTTYGSVELFLRDEFHYWLQRGEFEIGHGDPALGVNALLQASSLRPNDLHAETAWGHLLLSRACKTARIMGVAAASQDAQAGLSRLEGALATDPRLSPHTYHVYAKWGLEWVKVGRLGRSESYDLVKKIYHYTKKASYYYPDRAEIQEVWGMVERRARQLGAI